MKTRKNKYETILQQNKGFGWDDLKSWDMPTTPADRIEMKRLFGEYKIAQPTAPLRFINLRTPIL